MPTSKYKLRLFMLVGKAHACAHGWVNMNKSRTQLIFMVHAREITRKEHSGDDAGSGDVFDDDAPGLTKMIWKRTCLVHR